MKAYNADGTLNKLFIEYMRHNSKCTIDNVTYLRHWYYSHYFGYHWTIEDFNTHSIIYTEFESEE